MSSTTLVVGLVILVGAFLVGQAVAHRRAIVRERIQQALTAAATVVVLNRELLANAWVRQMLERSTDDGSVANPASRLTGERAEAHHMIRDLLKAIQLAKFAVEAGGSRDGTESGATGRDPIAAVERKMVTIANAWQRGFGAQVGEPVSPGERFADRQNRRAKQLESSARHLLEREPVAERILDEIYGWGTSMAQRLRAQFTGTRIDGLIQVTDE